MAATSVVYEVRISTNDGSTFTEPFYCASPSIDEAIPSVSQSSAAWSDFCVKVNAACGGMVLRPQYSRVICSDYYKLACETQGMPYIPLSYIAVGTRFYIGPTSHNRFIRIERIQTYSNAVQIQRLGYYKDNVQLFTFGQNINIGTAYGSGFSPMMVFPWKLWTVPASPNYSYIGCPTLSTRYNSTSGLFESIYILYWFNTSINIGEVLTTNWNMWLNGLEPVDVDDPYINIPDSTPSGPAEATGIPENDPVDIPNLPTVAVSDTGFVTLFNPTLAQVKDLADYMWSGLFDVDTLRKLFADPMDCILGFNMLPVSITNSGPATVKVGNISTGVSMNKATSQWVELDCGTLAIGDAFGNYLSYAPYTKFSIYLPYIGTVELSTDDVVGKTLALKYHVDVLSCACVAYLKCGTSVLYQFTGSCGYSIPINGNDFRTTIASVVSIAASIGGAVATGGLSAPAAVAVTASTVNNVMNSKPQIHRSGAIGSSAGILGIQKPYLIVEYPNPCKPRKQYHFTGYPSFVTVKLSDISGYAAFEEILIEGVPCTEEEQAMIKNLCKGGIFL